MLAGLADPANPFDRLRWRRCRQSTRMKMPEASNSAAEGSVFGTSLRGTGSRLGVWSWPWWEPIRGSNVAACCRAGRDLRRVLRRTERLWGSIDDFCGGGRDRLDGRQAQLPASGGRLTPAWAAEFVGGWRAHLAWLALPAGCHLRRWRH